MREHVRQQRGRHRIEPGDNPQKTPLTTIQLLARADRAGSNIGTFSLSETERILKDRGNWEGELRHRTKDGREIILSTRFQLIPGENGTFSILQINRDVTERKQVEEERAEELRRKDEFLSLLGHELRNPLAAISTAVQLLAGCASDDERASLNGMMDRQVKLMQRLLDDLIDLGRITHGHIQLKKGPINLARFLQHVTKVTQSITAQRGQEMILRLPSEVVTFKADEARLEQIAANLLNNASKYTPRGGRIELSPAWEIRPYRRKTRRRITWKET